MLVRRPKIDCRYIAAVFVAIQFAASSCFAGGQLYPDMFPFVSADAPSNLQTLQDWRLDGDLIRFNTMFANQGDGLFEIRRGPDVNAERYELLQRVYLNNDFGPEFEDINIGTAPIPGTANTPDPNDFNVIWFEDFTRFSLHEAPVVEGVVTVGNEVAGHMKTSWRLSANRGPLPEYPSDTPRYGGNDQTLEQRISVGWADLYSAGSRDQFLDISGVAFGPRYWLRQTVDPSNRIHETDETNNSFEVLIDLNNPQEAIMFGGEFVQPGDPAPPAPGDLNLDGVVDVGDWLTFKAGANTSLQGVDPGQAYLLGDLDLDGEHTISDVVLFRELYDNANGVGAFANAQQVPEPSTWLICTAAAVLLLARGPRLSRRGLSVLMICCVTGTAMFSSTAAIGQSLFFEDFEGLTLGPNVDEPVANPNAWTDTPPAGWTVDNSSLPDGGVTEWRGWTFADAEWWSDTADNQGRSEFTKASGAVAIADPDEWDDLPNDEGTFNSFLATPPISLAGAAPNTVRLRFDSSWRYEDSQTANLVVSFDGGPTTELFRWSSDNGDPNFKPDATNETVVVSVDNPDGAADMQLSFGMFDAGNDWWWAIDNIDVFTPTTLQVDTDTGEMTIMGAEGIAGYQITGPAGSLNPTGWQAGNLDAQDVGAAVELAGDLNNDDVVDGGDIATWAAAYRTDASGDVDTDGDTDGHDFLQLQREMGTALPAGTSWETVIANDDKLLEFFLLGDSTFEAQSIGHGYNTVQQDTNLSFTYSNAQGEEFDGAVTYVSSAVELKIVPEPTTALLLMVGSCLQLGSKQRSHTRAS